MSWYNTDPRETYSSGRIIVLGPPDGPVEAFFDADHANCWYIQVGTSYVRYHSISPGSEVEEWPSTWWWTWPPKKEQI